MKQRGVGEHPVEAFRRQIEGEKVLLPGFAATVGAGHFDKARAAVQTDSAVAHSAESAQIAPRPAAEIENLVGRRGLDMREQGGDILADIVIAGALTKVFGAVLIMSQGQ